MNDPARKSLLMTLKITLGMLHRYLRHDLWRITEPQHGQAVERIAETIVAKLEDGFEVEARPPKPSISFAIFTAGRRERVTDSYDGALPLAFSQ